MKKNWALSNKLTTLTILLVCLATNTQVSYSSKTAAEQEQVVDGANINEIVDRAIDALTESLPLMLP